MRSSSPLTAASLLGAAATVDVAAAAYATEDFRLTSFRWCDSQPCQYPDWAYPRHSNMNGQPGYALIVADMDYTISWDGNDPTEPVEFTWMIPPARDIAEKHELLSIEWSINITDAQNFTFNPGKILHEFPAALARNHSENELRLLADDITNIIKISQPTVANEEFGIEAPQAWSHQFQVTSGDVFYYFEASAAIARNKEKQKWVKGVGIGVGVGAPVMMAIVGFVTWKLATKAVEKRLNSGSKVVADA